MRRTPFFISSLALALPLILAASPSASAEERLPSLIHRVDSSTADIVEPTSHTSNVIFLNRCEGGCTINPGFNDSRTNHSSIPNSTSFITEFRHSQEDWEELVSCVRAVYEPFNIVITDEDPGQASHFEAIVAGTDDEIGVVAGGIAPGGCGITNNAITFSFANQGSLATLCWTVAQETAHAFGLDHVMDCNDPMTYLTSCGYDKTFQNNDAPCGEDENRGCYCGGSTQNSVRLIRDHFGVGQITPPEVAINRPTQDQVVKPNFPFEVAATDNIEVAKVEFFIEGVLVSELTSPPWVINAPDGLSGRVRAEARATDNFGTESTTAGVDVVIDDTLIDFAGECEQNDDCESNLCALDAEGKGRCSQLCELEAETNSCPADSKCISAGDQGICWADEGGSSGGCSASGSASWLSALFMLFALGLGRRRRRCRAN
jgi:uncharacterized protein (TIGR03382 family)